MVGLRVTKRKKSKIIRRFDGCCGQNICALVSIVQLPHARAEVRVSQMWRISIRAPRISLELSSEVKLQTVNGVTDVASLLLVRMVIHMRTLPPALHDMACNKLMRSPEI